MEVNIRSLIGIFTVIDGKINLLTNDNGLIVIDCNDTFEMINKKYIEENLNIKNLDLKQCYTFSEKKNCKLIISTIFIDVINFQDIILDNYKLLEINSLSSNKYIDKCIEYLSKNLILSSNVKKVFGEYITIPELQKLFEYLLDKKLDRRNFRKKLIKSDILEDINKVSLKENGRPAKLYKFKQIKEEKYLI